MEQRPHHPTASRALRDAAPRCYWTDRHDAPEPHVGAPVPAACDLLVVGGGYTGLWAAIEARRRDPSRHVVLVEQETVGSGASTRNGGFLEATLTHGLENGLTHFPNEIDRLVRLGHEGYDAIVATLHEHDVDAGYEPVGVLNLATEPHHVDGLEEAVARERWFGADVELLDGAAARAEVCSPRVLAGVWHRSHCGLVDPARLVWGLRRLALDLGVELHEGAAVTGLARDGLAVRAQVRGTAVRARRVLLATNAFPPLLGAIRRRIVPVYDYVLVTEPLSAEQRGSVGWARRQGLADLGEQFHYFRLIATPDGDRILWGGYDAVYHYGSRVAPELDQRPATFALLADQLVALFPQLDGIRFTHRWGGAIDTTTDFTVSFGTALDGRVAYAVGYTGLGVAASRFGALVGLDLLDPPGSGLGDLALVQRRPFPFPPEPLRWAAVTLTRRAIARADANGGRRGPWLRLLDRFGVGFDS